jgi:hypothetical protein
MPTTDLVPLADKLSGGEGRIDFIEYMARVHAAMARDVPSLATLKETQPGGTLLICGGGPSIGDLAQLKKIRALMKKGGKVWAVNKTHDFLLTKGITPWAACLLDPMPWVAGYIQKPQRNTIYAVASQCDAAVFDALKQARVYLWHAGVDYFGQGYPVDVMESTYKGRDWLVIPGPTTVGLRSVLVGYALGFRHFHLFGLDSSMRVANDNSSALHAYEKQKPADAAEGWVTLKSKTAKNQTTAQRFYTNSHMARQALDFEEMVENIGGMVKRGTMQPITLTVHGDGLIPALADCYGWRAA